MLLRPLHRIFAMSKKACCIRISRLVSMVAVLLCASLVVAACGFLGSSGDPGASDTGGQQVEVPGGGQTPPTDAEAPPTGTDDPDDDDGDSDSVSEEPLGDGDGAFTDVFTDMFVPGDALDILGKFAVLAYRWETITVMDGEDPIEADNIEVRFEWLGREEVNGEMTDKIHVVVETPFEEHSDEMTLWLDSDGVSIKAVIGDDEYPPELAAMYSTIIVPVLLMPFDHFDSYFQVALDGGRFAITDRSTDRTQILGHEAVIEKLAGGGAISGFGEGAHVELEIARFSDFRIMLRGKAFDSANSIEFIFTPLEMEMR